MENRSRSFFLGRILGTLIFPPLALGALLFLIFPVLQIGRVFSSPDGSMSPAISKGDCLFVSQTAYLFSPPDRGDIVVFRSEGILSSKGAWYAERIEGLPGDTLSLHFGQIWINGSKAIEFPNIYYQSGVSYLVQEGDSYVVPAGHYFVLGDDPSRSLDSRYWGALPADKIKGRILFRLWPPARFGWVK